MKPLLAILVLSSVAYAEVPRNQLAYDVNVKESIVGVGEQKYRRLEYKGEVFYLRLLEPEKTAMDLHLECGTETVPPILNNQVVISTSVKKRSTLFLSGLKQVCAQGTNANKRIITDPNVQAGFRAEF